MDSKISSIKPQKLVDTLCIGILILIVLSCCGSTPPAGTETAGGKLLEFLRYVPDTEQYRQWLTYGDAEAWYSAWGIPRPATVEAMRNSDPKTERPYLYFVLHEQTFPPQSLGVQYLFSEDQRQALGFDILNLDRYLDAGQPPSNITILEFGFDKQMISNALSEFGYQSQKMGSGQLYSTRGDYEVDISSPLKTTRMGSLNRILLLNDKMIIARATPLVQSALDTGNNKFPSLADNASYIAAVQSLDNPALEGMGVLVGTILIDGDMFQELGPRLGKKDEFDALLESYSQDPLPTFDLAAFTSFQEDRTAFLIISLVFPKGIDAQAAADLIAERVSSYTSLRFRKNLGELLTFEKAVGIDSNGLPVALIVFSSEVTEPTETSEGNYSVGIMGWLDFMETQDILFLKTEP